MERPFTLICKMFKFFKLGSRYWLLRSEGSRSSRAVLGGFCKCCSVVLIMGCAIENRWSSVELSSCWSRSLMKQTVKRDGYEKAVNIHPIVYIIVFWIQWFIYHCFNLKIILLYSPQSYIHQVNQSFKWFTFYFKVLKLFINIFSEE